MPTTRSEILQKLNAVKHTIAEAVKQVEYGNALKITCLLDSYIEGKLSFIFKLHARLQPDDMRLVGLSMERNAIVNLTAFILYGESANSSNGLQSQQEDVLVRIVDVVKRPDQRILPSVVRLYIGHDDIEKIATPGVYFDAVKGIFYAFPSFANGEAVVVGDCPRSMQFESAGPRVIEDDSQIVNCIPGYQGQLQKAFGQFGMFMLNRFCASVAILVDCGDCVFFQRRNSGFQVRDMLIGPVNLQTGISKLSL